MYFYVYMLISKGKKPITYVGYTNNLKNRLKNHNSNKGAKYTKGNKWKIIYKKNFLSKKKAMSYEYILKHDKKERIKIYNRCK